MKTTNKKVPIHILVVGFVGISLLLLLRLLVFDNGISVYSNEKDYVNSKSYTDLYNLCNSLFITKRYEKILEYYPLLLETEGFDENVKKDESWNHDKKESTQEIKSTFVIAYLNAYTEVNGSDGLIDEMNRYSKYFYWNIDDENTNLMFSTIVMFLHKNPKTLISVYDTDKGEKFLYTFKGFVKSAELSKSTKDFCDIFVKESLLLINSYNEQKTLAIVNDYDGVDYRFYPGDEYCIPLINGFSIIKDEFENEIYLGKVSYLDNVTVWVDGKITSYFCSDEYIFVEQKHEQETKSYYIIDLANESIGGPYNLNAYNQELKRIGLKVDLTPVED